MSVKTIYVKTTDTCNLNCAHCFTSGRYGGKLAWDPIKSQRWLRDFIAQHPESEHFHIELHGGEPFLVPLSSIKTFLAPFVDDPRISVGATTNLVYRLTPELVEFIKTTLAARIATSWDGWGRFENRRQYRLWRRNLRTLKAAGVTVKLFVTVTRKLLARPVEKLLALLERLGVDEVAIERLTLDGNARLHPGLFPDNRAQDQYYYDLYRAYRARSWSFRITTLEVIEEKFRTRAFKVDTNCRTCEQQLVTMNADGSLAGCPNGAARERSGSIEEPVETFLLSEARLTRITKELDYDPRCLRCELFDVCGGDCHRLPWQGNSCPGLRKLLTHFKRRSNPFALVTATKE